MHRISFVSLLALIALFQSSCNTSRSSVSSSDSASDIVSEYYGEDGEGTGVEDLSGSQFTRQISPYAEGLYQGSYTREQDLIHTLLRVSPDWSKSQLQGEATLTLRPYFYSTDRVSLDAKGFDVHEVALLDELGAKSPLTYEYDKLKLDIALNREYHRDETYKLYIRYTARPEDLPKGGSEAITDDKGLYFINPDGSIPNKPTQLWTQGETESSSCWFPTLDQSNERCTQEIYITVDNKYSTLSNGLLKQQTNNADGTRTDYWVMELPHAPYLFMMAIGEFARVEDRWEDIVVDYYVDPEYEPYARAIFGNTPEMLAFYSEILGVRYPWSKYSQVVVEEFVSGAMENTTAVIHYGGLHSTDRELLDSDNESIIAHEAIHHWFGDLVTCESWANLPLNESFATYGEYLWFEYKYGREFADSHLNDDLELYMQEAAMKQEPLIRFGYEDKEDMFDSHSYQKGGRVLHMLRKQIGDEAFFASLKKYLQDHAFSDVEMHEFRMAVEDVVGQDFNWFFNQWFYEPGHPQLEFSYRQDSETGNWIVGIRQLQSELETPVYRIPLDIDVYSGGKAERTRVVLDRRSQEFTLNSNNPDWINVDAERMLLAEIDDQKPQAWYERQLKEGPLFADRLFALDYFAELAEEDEYANAMVVSAFDDAFWGIQELALDAYVVPEQVDEKLVEKLIAMARGHKKSAVRVSALRNLGAFENPEYLPLFEAGLSDSSWRVVGTSLREMGRLDADLAMKKAQELEDTKHTSVTVAVLGIYSAHGGPEKNQVFLNKLENTGGWEKYLVIQEYSNYMTRLDDMGTVVDGCMALAESAGNSDIWWMKHVAERAIRTVLTRYEDEKDELSSSASNYAAQTQVLEEQISRLESILEGLGTN